ncbi:MAG: nitronate monooxygenase, partial [Oscillospiraceae bacterium]
VQMGTVFLASDECQIHENYKNLVLHAKDTDSVVTGRISGCAACRQLRNKFTKNILAQEKEGLTQETFEQACTGSLRKAVQDGDRDHGSFMAGQIAGMIHEVKSCKEILETIFQDGEELLKDRYRQFTK